MAVDQDLLDQIAGTVADLYREVEASLITVIADELKKGLDAPTAEVKLDAIQRLRTAAVAVHQRLQKTKSATVREAIRTAYRDGHASALLDLPVSAQVRAEAREARSQVPGAAVIENIAAALHRDLGVVEGNILRAPIDAYRAVQAATAARIATGTVTRRQASQAAWQRLMDQGIASFTDRAGRRWRLSSYAEMIGRTNAARAAIQGQMDRLASVGIDLVYVSDNTQECKRCRPFESKVLRRNTGPVGRIRVEHATKDGELVEVDVLATLDQARDRGFQHPNCRHSVSAYLPGVTRLKENTEDPEGDVARQKQRALERKIRAEKEQALGALTPEGKKAAGKRVRAAQAALRDHLAAHPTLKRLPYREQIGAGNTPPAGGPKGGPVTDLTPPAPSTPNMPDTAAAEKDQQEAEEKARAAEAKEAAKAKAAEAARKAAQEKAKKAAAAPGMRAALRHHNKTGGLEWARKNLPLPDGLTDAERHAVVRYTEEAYNLVNGGLRGKPMRPDYRDRYDKLVANLDAAFKKSRLPESLIVHRGVGAPYVESLGADITRPETMAALVGKTFTEDGFVSTSVGYNAAFSNKVYLMLRVPKGYEAMNVMPISDAGEDEREVLLRRGARYVVHAAYQRKNAWFMELEIVPDGWERPPGWAPDPYGDADEGYTKDGFPK